MQCKVFSRILTVWGLSILLLLAVVWPIARAQSPELHQRLAPAQPVGGTGEVSTAQDIGIASVSTLYPSDDAPVQGGNPTAATPTNHYLGAGNYADSPPPWANGLVRSYIRFDLSSLTSTYIASATLRLYQAGGSDYPGQTRTVTFYRVTGSWNEASITWNNRPGYAEAVGSVATTYNYDGWVSIDVTNLVRAWVNGSQANYGLVAIGPEGITGIYRAFFSREDARSPELQVNYRPPQPPVLDALPGWLRAGRTQPAFTSSFQIFNVTSNSLNWSAAQVGNASWLGLGSASGAATSTSPGNLALHITPTGLVAGVYTTQLRISSNTTDVVGSPLTVTIALEVLDQLSSIYLPLILKSGGASSPPQIAALVVGIADYQYLGASPQGSDYLPDTWGYDLYAPQYDVEDVSNWLTGIGVSVNNIIKRKESAATRANFIAAFNDLDQKESKDTIVIIYYSGHGGQTPDAPSGDESDGYDEFIAMYDTYLGAERYENVITDDDLQDRLATLESEHVVVIIDSCYSGGMISTAMQAMSEPGDLLRRGLANPFRAGSISAQDTLGDLVGPGRVIITGGTGDQITWESKTLQNGIFTYFFLPALQDASNDANQNKRLSAEEAYWFSRDSVDMWVSTNVITHQNPDISDQHFGQVDLTWLP